MKLILKKFFLFSIMWPHILAFFLSKRKGLIKEDLERRRIYISYNYKNDFTAYFCEVLWRHKEYRNLFYLRVGRVVSFFLNIIFPAMDDIDLGDCFTIGGGLVLLHGHGIIVNKYSVIGKNCTIYHGVTIGAIDNGVPPKIGDNVYIGCGAKVLGHIKIGNNVKIGAGAVVVKNVPDNATVVGVPARIIKQTR